MLFRSWLPAWLDRILLHLYIDRRKIQLDDPIRQLGEYKVPVKLHKDVTVEITVVVEKEE